MRRVRQRLFAAGEPPWLHAEAARRMAERLAFIRQPPVRVLDWSEAPGEPPAPLRSACPAAVIGIVGDPAAVPVPAWWQRWRPGAVAPARRVLPSSVPAGQADLVWSCMALHRQPDPVQAFSAWRQALAADGFVLYTTLGPGTLRGLHRLYADLGWGEPFAPFVDMHDLGDMMVESGLADPVMDQDVLYLTFGSPEAALRELRSLGSNLAPARMAGLRTPRWHARLLSALEKTADSQGRITLEFELVHGHAFRAPDRGPAVMADTRIALDDMKLMLRKPRDH